MSAIPKSNKANKVVIFMVDKKKNNLFNQHINSVQNSSDFDCEIINSADEVIQYLNMTPSALLMFEIHDRESLTQVLNVMKSVDLYMNSAASTIYVIFLVTLLIIRKGRIDNSAKIICIGYPFGIAA